MMTDGPVASPDLGAIGIGGFLEEYWQRQPCLLRQAYPDFLAELDTNDIAGLACEDDVEARLVSGSFDNRDWVLEYGPFEESRLESLPTQNWTLLVQDVEKHYPPLKRLLDGFGFIPSWRMDDLMVSVAAPGGSVGPHVDQYDVFLLQAEGRRRWQIAMDFSPELLPDTELNVLKEFSPQQEWTLAPGDMLYLPLGVAHHGVALETGMTWSIGLRAPSTADVLQAYGEWLATHHSEGRRFSDPGRGQSQDRHCISRTDSDRFRNLFTEAGRSNRFEYFLGEFISQYRMAQRPAPPPQKTRPSELAKSLRDGQRLRQNPWTRLLWMAQDDGQPGNATLFAQGDQFHCTRDHARQICDSMALAQLDAEEDETLQALLCRLLDKGHLYLEAV